MAWRKDALSGGWFTPIRYTRESRVPDNRYMERRRFSLNAAILEMSD
jgi:hypothetical protein